MAASSLERLIERLDELEASLTEAHDYQCGCDVPGDLSICVALPQPAFRLLRGGELEPDERAELERLLQQDT